MRRVVDEPAGSGRARGIATSREVDGDGPLAREDHRPGLAPFGVAPGRAITRRGVAGALGSRGRDAAGRPWYREARLAASLGTTTGDAAFAAAWRACVEAWAVGSPSRHASDEVRGVVVDGEARLEPASYAAFERMMRRAGGATRRP